MYTDKLNEFSTAQAITATDISNVLDRLNANNDFITGEKLALVVQVTASFNNLTSMTISLESDSTEDLATSATVHCSRTILLAGLVAGKTYTIGIPGGAPSERYVGVRYTVTGTDPTTGAVNAWLVKDVQANPADAQPGAPTA